MYSNPSSGGSAIEWVPAAIVGDTYAPTPIMLEEVPPGAPTVVNAGPLFPALLTNIKRCLFTTWMHYHRCRQKKVKSLWLHLGFRLIQIHYLKKIHLHFNVEDGNKDWHLGKFVTQIRRFRSR